MTQSEIDKSDNELIAEFMGTKIRYGRVYIQGRGGYIQKNYPNQLKYHNKLKKIYFRQSTKPWFISLNGITHITMESKPRHYYET